MSWNTVGLILVAPYVLVFLLFVVYPVGYGFYLGRHPESYVKLFNDPVFLQAVLNTFLFITVVVNVKFVLVLVLSWFFVQERAWVRVVAVLFILPWAVPSIPTILSFRFMLNPEWGIVNSVIFRLFHVDGPNWLNDRWIAFSMAGLVHIWKSLPFWTLILVSGRLAIPKELYEASAVDGATGWQQFRWVTWPSIRNLYLTCTIISMIWTLGDFNSVYLLTGGGPSDLTHVLATLGIRYLRLDQVDMSMATIVVAMPVVMPLVYYMVRHLSKGPDEA
ncbi:MAG TPA: sugar ABC transporter permease [Usitatibacter sp.]|nr:sugar ABC transporter permease [Usitatibacter sp.]